MRLLYCMYVGCGDSVEIVAGQFPVKCPGCGRVAKWSTTPGNLVKPKHAKEPRVKFDLTLNDKRLLKSLRIETEEDDSEDDCA